MSGMSFCDVDARMDTGGRGMAGARRGSEVVSEGSGAAQPDEAAGEGREGRRILARRWIFTGCGGREAGGAVDAWWRREAKRSGSHG